MLSISLLYWEKRAFVLLGAEMKGISVSTIK